MLKGLALKKFQFFCAASTLFGMTVGVGIFGIPYAFAKAGFTTGLFYLVFLGLAVMTVHLFYGEVVLRTSGQHRLVGYAELYLGSWAKKIATFSILLGYYGALLAYIIIAGEFLSVIFGGQDFMWSLVFFTIAAIPVFFGFKTLSRGEFFVAILFVCVMLTVMAKASFFINLKNYSGFNLNNFFLPYGVILFAMAGAAAIPEMRQILRGQEKNLKKAIILGTLLPFCLYLLFACAVVGVSGPQTSEEAIMGLAPFLGGWVVKAGAAFGVMTMFTSFLGLGFALKKMYSVDYKVKNAVAYVLVCSIPLLAFLAGLKNFIFIIGLVGAVVGGIDGVLMILIYLRAKKKGDRHPEYSLARSRFLAYVLTTIFLLGIVYQFIYISGH